MIMIIVMINYKRRVIHSGLLFTQAPMDMVT